MRTLGMLGLAVALSLGFVPIEAIQHRAVT